MSSSSVPSWLPESWLPPSAPLLPPPTEAAAGMVVDQVSARMDQPGWVSVLIPVVIAAVVTSLLYPNTTKDIRELWEDQLEEANSGPWTSFDNEPIELEPKYGITPVSNETKLALRVALGEVDAPIDNNETNKPTVLVSDQIRQFWQQEIVEQANKAPDIRNQPIIKMQQQLLPTETTKTTTLPQPGVIPSIPKQASAEELTSLLSSVAEAVQNTGKDFDAIIAERKERAAANAKPPRQRKRDVLRKTTKKLMMPWRKWENL